MKNTLLFSSLLCISGVFAQESSHNVSLGVSNNGQLSSTIDDFYLDNDIIGFPSSSTTAFKINAEYSFKSKNNLEFGLTAGYAQRDGKYKISTTEGKYSQQYYSATPFLLKVWSFDRLQLSTGAGIPLYYISDLEDVRTSTLKVTRTTDGGMAFGLNSITRLKFHFTEKLFLVTAVNFGILHSDLGGQVRFKWENGNFAGPASNPLEHNSTVLTAPEFSFGIGFKI